MTNFDFRILIFDLSSVDANVSNRGVADPVIGNQKSAIKNP